MSKRYQYILTLAAACALGLSATCQAAGLDACKLIDASLASKILGRKIEVHAMHASSMCRYSGHGIGTGFMLIAAHVNYKNAAKEVAERQKLALSDMPPGLPKPSFTNIKGLGDAAYLAKASGYFQLHVLTHGNVVVINRNTAATPAAVAQTEELARAALKRLK